MTILSFNMTAMHHSFKIYFFLLLAGLTAMVSCKKEYETVPSPYNEITSFKVAYLGGQDSLRAVIDGETIRIAWPATVDWPMPTTVQPGIKVSSGARVSPASGEAVPLSSGTIFTVTAADGSVRTYTLQVSSSMLLPDFADENVVQARVGGEYSIRLNSLAGDGSDSLFLIGADQQEYKPIHTLQQPATEISFITDQEDGSGMPAGEYYVKVVNKFGVPVTSKNPMVVVSDEAPTPYLYYRHTSAIEVKRGETFTLPIRHYEGYEINRIRCYYRDPVTGYSSYFGGEYVGANEDSSEISIRIPEDAPTGISLRLEKGIQIRFLSGGKNVTSSALYYPYPITIVE